MRARRRQQGGRLVVGLAAMVSSLPGVVSAASPAILYVPDEPVTLRPFNAGSCGSSVDSALGCANVEAETEIPPFADAATLTTDIGTALAAYDVLVTNVRPPEYISYVMLMADDTANETSQSFTCTGAGINCAARQRNDLVFTYGTTMNCTNPAVTHAALHAFGRVSGLEGVVNPADYMNYVPNYTVPPMGFQDVCSDRVNQIGFDAMGTEVPLPFECTGLDHFECPDGMNGEPQQNSHQDLLLYYGARTVDSDPPVLSQVMPEDGAVLPSGDPLTLDFIVVDSDPVVGARWVISSPALVDVGVEDGTLTHCTNDVCDSNWVDATPLKATDSQWQLDLAGLPDGDYTLTLEVADYHGHVAETLTMSVTIGAGGSSESGGSSSSSSEETFGATYFPADFTDSASFTDSAGGSGPTTSGCACSASRRGSPVRASAWLLLLAGAALRRRAPCRERRAPTPSRPR